MRPLIVSVLVLISSQAFAFSPPYQQKSLPPLPDTIDHETVRDWILEANDLTKNYWEYSPAPFQLLWPAYREEIMAYAEPWLASLASLAMDRASFEQFSVAELVEIARALPDTFGEVASQLRKRGQTSALLPVLKVSEPDKMHYRQEPFFEVCAELKCDPGPEAFVQWFLKGGDRLGVLKWYRTVHPDEMLAFAADLWARKEWLDSYDLPAHLMFASVGFAPALQWIAEKGRSESYPWDRQKTRMEIDELVEFPPEAGKYPARWQWMMNHPGWGAPEFQSETGRYRYPRGPDVGSGSPTPDSTPPEARL